MSTRIPFKKHLGQEVEHVSQVDPTYLFWLLSRWWLKDKYPDTYKAARNQVYLQLRVEIEKQERGEDLL